MSDSYNIAANAVERPPLTRVDARPSFWRREDPTFDEEGAMVEGGMFSHQREWWELPNFIKMMLGGYGAGKTLAGSKRIIASALQNAPIPVAAVSPTFPVARTTTIATISELLEGKRRNFGKKFDWSYNVTTHEFKIKYKGRVGTIIVYSGERPLALRGPNLGAAWIDEPFIQQYEVFEQMIARVRHKLARSREIFMTGTPEQLNWGYDLCQGELREKFDIGLVVGSTRQNLAIAEDYVARLESSFSEKAAQAYIDGQFVNLSEGLVYFSFNPAENIIDVKAPNGATVAAGMDFNVSPMAGVVGWYTPNHMHIMSDIELPNSDTEDMCAYIREKHPECVEVCPDASGASRHTNAPGGKSDFDYIREAGFEISVGTVNPKIRDRLNSVNGLLKAKDGRVRLTISPKCKKLIKYLTLYSHEKKTSQVAMSHMLDALGYLVYRKFPVGKFLFEQKRLRGV